MVYKVYVLYSAGHDKLFTGMTASLIDQMISHNGESSDDWTGDYQPWMLVHMELFDDANGALMRQKYLESTSGRTYIREQVLPLFEFK